MERLNFQAIEKNGKQFSKKINYTIIRQQKNLLPRNVSLPIRKNTYGARKKLYYRRRYSPI